MKLWLVVYVGTQVGGSWGPLPYDQAECLVRANEMNLETRTIAETGINSEGVQIPQENRDQLATFRFVCEHRRERPIITVGQ